MSFEAYKMLIEILQPHIYHVAVALVIVIWWIIVIKSVIMVVKGVFTGHPSGKGIKLYALQAAYGIVAREITKFIFKIIADNCDWVTLSGYWIPSSLNKSLLCLLIIRGIAIIPLVTMELKLNGINRISDSWRKRK